MNSCVSVAWPRLPGVNEKELREDQKASLPPSSGARVRAELNQENQTANLHSFIHALEL